MISITAGRRATLDKSNNIYNEYERAAALMKEFVQEENFIIPTQSDEIEKALATFRKKFAPEFLANLKDDEILTSLFYTEGDNTNSLLLAGNEQGKQVLWKYCWWFCL